MRLRGVGVACLLVVLGALRCPAQDASGQISLPPELAAAFADRTPLDVPGRDSAVVDAIRHASQFSFERLVDAAADHAERRQRDLSVAAGEPVEDYSPVRDLLRFPEPNRGHAVAERGVVESVNEITLEEDHSAILMAIAPADAPGATLAVVLPAESETPSVGQHVQVVGVFLKLAFLPSGAEGDSSVVPVLAAPVVVAEEPGAGVLPDRSLWQSVRHRSLGVSAEERGLYYRLLKQAASVDPDALREAAAEHLDRRQRQRPGLRDRQDFPVFVDVFENPASYEGQAVTLRGYAREIRTYPAGENAEGIETLYEAWVFTDDSQSNPAIVIATDVSDGMPIGDDLQVPIRTTGYFFKIYGYRAHDTARVAPMFLASELERLPEPRFSGPPIWMLVFLGGVFTVLLAWIVWSYLGTRRRRRTLPETPDFSTLAGEDVSGEEEASPGA